MVVLLFQHLAVAAQTSVDLADLGHLFFRKVVQHHAEDASQCSGVLAGAVRFVGRQLQMLVDGALLVVVQTGVHGLRHGQGVDIGRLQLDAAALGCCPQKAHIKGVDVVSHQNAVTCKGKEGFQRFLFAGRIRYHLVGDASQLGDLGGDGLARLDEGIKLLHHLAIADDDRANLGKVLYPGVKTGGLCIEHAELAVQRLILYAIDAGHHIVHKIGFAPVDEFEIRVLFVDIIRCQHGFRVALTHAVVGDGNGGVSHAVRQLDDAAGVAEAVHAGKLGVQM